MVLFIKCRRDEFFGNKEVKRGKPRERETQIWQGSLNERIRMELRTGKPVDRCLSPNLLGTKHGLFILFINQCEVYMKELGEYLKRTRLSNGVSIAEAAEDLELSTSQI